MMQKIADSRLIGFVDYTDAYDYECPNDFTDQYLIRKMEEKREQA